MQKLQAWVLVLAIISVGSAGTIGYGYQKANDNGIYGDNSIIISQSLGIKDAWFSNRGQYGMLPSGGSGWINKDNLLSDDSGMIAIAEDGLSFTVGLQINNGDDYEIEFVINNSAKTNITAMLIDPIIDIEVKYGEDNYHNDTIEPISETEWIFTIPANSDMIIDLDLDVGNTVSPGFYEITIEILPTKYNLVSFTRSCKDFNDIDGDGIANWLELDDTDGHTTDPLDADTDDDGIIDGDEDDPNGMVDPDETDPLNQDTDGDGLQDGTELSVTTPNRDTDPSIFQPDLDPTTSTDPLDPDSDDDNLLDGTEDANHNGKIEGDTHNYGTWDDDETWTETDPNDDDTDDDGLIDGWGSGEDTNQNGQYDEGTETNPFNRDTDGDGLSDGLELGLVNPEGSDTDPSWQPDLDPGSTTDPLNPDSDGDGINDGDEDINHNGRVDPGETDPNAPNAGSCPFLYAWNGEEFEFINELTPGPLGKYDRKGKRINKKRWEEEPFYVNPRKPYNVDYYQKIESNQIQPLDGKYEIRYTEELDELNYADLLELWTLDHEPGVEVYTDWTYRDNIFTVENPVPPISAVDHNGENVLSLISAKDWDEWISEWRDLEYKDMNVNEAIENNYGGYITLKLGDWDENPENLKLVITENKESHRNEIISSQFNEMVKYYGSKKGNIKLSEIKGGAKLQILNDKSEWVDAPNNYQRIQIASKKLPEDKKINSAVRSFNVPNSFVIDLSGLNLKDNLIRYWIPNPIIRNHIDRILVDTSGPHDVTITKLKPSNANLQYRGSAKQGQVLFSKSQNEWNYGYDYYDGFFNIDYNDVLETGPVQTGKYTRFGDVLPIVQSTDDEFVIMAKGDELSLQFDYTEPTPGFERDIIFRVFGYYKGEGFAYSGTVDPLPFKGMKMYPYDETIENYDYEGHADYIENYQTRVFE